MNFRGPSILKGIGRLWGGHERDDAMGDSTNLDSDVVQIGGKTDNGDEVRIPPGADVAVRIPENADVDPENIESGLTEAAAERTVLVEGQSNDGGSATVNPVASGSKDKLGGIYSDVFEDIEQGFHRIDDDKVQKLRENRVDYNQRIGKWILQEDDRVPAILNSQVALILGQSGVEVEPDDPDNGADVRLAEHLRAIYDGSDEADIHVDPGDVVRNIMAQNYMSAKSVVRSTDLAELPLDTVTYYRDPEDGSEYCLQDETAYQKLVVSDDGETWETERRTTDEQLLELGTHVFDAQLFARKPLQSVADLVVNKMVLQRLMARKAEIASVGGLYIKVNPPDWLQESEYHDTVPDPENDGETIKKLELHMREGVNSAFSTLEDYQSGFIMSIPSHWEVDQIEVPETGEPMADQIRAYNKSIAARLMFPIDLMELQQGAELSRDSLLTTLLNVISGWRSEILGVFDGFAEVQKDIHNLNGSVSHTLPKLESEDEGLILQALRHAGLAGMSTKEVRQALNRVEGFNLEEQPEGEPAQQGGPGGPPPGGPPDPNEREQSMRDMLDPDGENDDDEDDTDEGAAAKFTPPEGLDMYEMEGWDQTSVWRAFLSLGGTHRTCSKRMRTELRNPDAWCAALKDQALGTDLWRSGGGADPCGDPVDPPSDDFTPAVYAADPTDYEYDGSLDDFAGIVESVLEDNLDSDVIRLQSEDDYVAFSPGGVDPTEDEDADGFSPVVVVKSGDGEYSVSGASEDDLSGLETELGEAVFPARPYDVDDSVVAMSTDELLDRMADDRGD